LETLNKTDDTLKKYKKACLKDLKEMEKNGIWNCHEFATFAFIAINDSKILEKYGYKINFNTLSNPKAYAEEKNHDHIFVIITDKQNNPLFVVDLWQRLASGKSFIGSFSDFKTKLNENIDGQYVYTLLDKNHFVDPNDLISRDECSGEADPGSNYHTFKK
jgi:hypothetical protein